MDNIISIPSSAKAISKLDEEWKSFKGDNYAKAIGDACYRTLKFFCEQNNDFAFVLSNTKRTISDVVYEVSRDWQKKHITSVSDFEVYEAIIHNYFPNAELKFKMELKLGEMPTMAEAERQTVREKPKAEPPKSGKDKTDHSASKEKPTQKSAEPSLFDYKPEGKPENKVIELKPGKAEEPQAEKWEQMFLFDLM